MSINNIIHVTTYIYTIVHCEKNILIHVHVHIIYIGLIQCFRFQQQILFYLIFLLYLFSMKTMEWIILYAEVIVFPLRLSGLIISIF